MEGRERKCMGRCEGRSVLMRERVFVGKRRIVLYDGMKGVKVYNGT